MAAALRRAVTAIALLIPTAVRAGAPFLTDDPQPSEPGHWEIYAPLVEVEGSGRNFAGTAGVELNYGAAPDLQLTVGLPIAFTHQGSGWSSGIGDVEASVKYRFVHDEAAGLAIAVFPAVTLPTAVGNKRPTLFLPVWAQQDIGRWSVFGGGGGYNFNPGAGNRDYWSGGIGVTRQLGERVLFGAELDREGPGGTGERATTSLGLGGIVDLPGPLRLLASAGPTFADGPGRGFHAFAALGLDF